ncbi:MAG TPA: hypothetical protein DDW51_07375, partial [Cyanobacteria bacterium UBA11367]|nr:hypothetical protein [Cyanobacteria bacterium UBA11367]
GKKRSYPLNKPLCPPAPPLSKQTNYIGDSLVETGTEEWGRISANLRSSKIDRVTAPQLVKHGSGQKWLNFKLNNLIIISRIHSLRPLQSDN